MIRLVTLGGTGDAYLVCALFDAFRMHHGREDVIVVGPEKYRCIADLFGVPWHSDDAIVDHAHRHPEFQRTYENVLLAPDTTFYVHPCFLRSEIRVDKLTTKPHASQADMYRMILRVPLEVPLAVPTRVPRGPTTNQNRVILIPEAVSWPNTQPFFWKMLADDLLRIGRDVIINPPNWNLRYLLQTCAESDWVIGPQCGVMSILVTGRFPCRKTLCSARLDDANKKLAFLAPQTFPYALVTKFSTVDYDVEEYEITDHNHAEIVNAITAGANALRLRDHDPRPVMTIEAPLSPGDFLDRLAVLTVKRRRFKGAKRAAVEREYRRFDAIKSYTPFPPEAEEAFDQLVAIHDRTFQHLDGMVPAALAGQPNDHDTAVRLNRDRVMIKNRIDDVCRSPWHDVKNYFEAT